MVLEKRHNKDKEMKSNYIILTTILLLALGCNENSYKKPKKDIYVDILKGNNNNSGEKKSPYKNLTYALQQLTATFHTDYTIYMAEGNYTKKTGEDFPINIPSYVKIKEFESNKKDVLIRGFGKSHINFTDKNITLILNKESSLNSIVIEGNLSTNNIGIHAYQDSSIEFSKIKNSYIGIYIEENMIINNSSIVLNHYGLEAQSSAAITLNNTNIYSNKIGFFLRSNSLTTNASEIRYNQHCNLLYDSHSDLHIKGIRWNTNILHLEKSNECLHQQDIVEIGNGSIQYLVNLRENTFLFNNEDIDHISIEQPSFGALIDSKKPTIEITPTKHKLFKVGVFKNKPIVENNEIINKEDLVWTWDTSMRKDPNSFTQYIPFNEGKGYLNSGQHYYISLWGWDNQGLKINLTSTISYFVIDN